VTFFHDAPPRSWVGAAEGAGEEEGWVGLTACTRLLDGDCSVGERHPAAILDLLTRGGREVGQNAVRWLIALRQRQRREVTALIQGVAPVSSLLQGPDAGTRRRQEALLETVRGKLHQGGVLTPSGLRHQLQLQGNSTVDASALEAFLQLSPEESSLLLSLLMRRAPEFASGGLTDEELTTLWDGAEEEESVGQLHRTLSTCGRSHSVELTAKPERPWKGRGGGVKLPGGECKETRMGELIEGDAAETGTPPSIETRRSTESGDTSLPWRLPNYTSPRKKKSRQKQLSP